MFVTKGVAIVFKDKEGVTSDGSRLSRLHGQVCVLGRLGLCGASSYNAVIWMCCLSMRCTDCLMGVGRFSDLMLIQGDPPGDGLLLSAILDLTAGLGSCQQLTN